MNNIQINGQRRWGPPEDWNGPLPAHGTEVFVKNLPEEVFEVELSKVFSRAGSVYEVRLPVNWSGFNKGYAFVRFTQMCHADAAVRMLDGFEIRSGRRLKVARSIDNTRLFLSAVPVDMNADEIKAALLNYVDNVKRVYVYPTLENRSVFRGYAFVEFETHRDAAIAKRVLTPDMCYAIFEKKCVAAWANPLPFLDTSTLESLNVLFVRNIPKDIKGFHLKKIVENLMGDDNQVGRVKRLNDFAFLTFKDHESAERALTILKSVPFLIPDHETQVEWAIPKELASSCLPTLGRENPDLITADRRAVKSSKQAQNESINNSGTESSTHRRSITKRNSLSPHRLGRELYNTGENDFSDSIMSSLKNNIMKYMEETRNVDFRVELSASSSGICSREVTRRDSAAPAQCIPSPDTCRTFLPRARADVPRFNFPFTKEHYLRRLQERKESLFLDDYYEFGDNLSPPSSMTTSANAMCNENNQFTRARSPDSDCTSRDLEDCAGRSRQSSYSSWPPSPTNYSSSSPTEMQFAQDERFLLKHLTENFRTFK